MDASRFDLLVRYLSRRGVAALIGAGLLTGWLPVAAACKANTRPCERGNQCCSGICRGRRKHKKCRRAGRQGICTIESGFIRCDDGTGTSACFCRRKSGGAAFCGTNSVSCNSCARDVDCPFAGQHCLRAASCPTGRACGRACSNPA